jgi:hypothetical protein
MEYPGGITVIDDPLVGYPCQKEDPFVCQMWKALMVLVLIASVVFLFLLMVLTSGCISTTKEIVIEAISTPVS